MGFVVGPPEERADFKIPLDLYFSSAALNCRPRPIAVSNPLVKLGFGKGR